MLPAISSRTRPRHRLTPHCSPLPLRMEARSGQGSLPLDGGNPASVFNRPRPRSAHRTGDRLASARGALHSSGLTAAGPRAWLADRFAVASVACGRRTEDEDEDEDEEGHSPLSGVGAGVARQAFTVRLSHPLLHSRSADASLKHLLFTNRESAIASPKWLSPFPPSLKRRSPLQIRGPLPRKPPRPRGLKDLWRKRTVPGSRFRVPAEGSGPRNTLSTRTRTLLRHPVPSMLLRPPLTWWRQTRNSSHWPTTAPAGQWSLNVTVAASIAYVAPLDSTGNATYLP